MTNADIIHRYFSEQLENMGLLHSKITVESIDAIENHMNNHGHLSDGLQVIHLFVWSNFISYLGAYSKSVENISDKTYHNFLNHFQLTKNMHLN